jgi:hypothetical protein
VGLIDGKKTKSQKSHDSVPLKGKKWSSLHTVIHERIVLEQEQ